MPLFCAIDQGTSSTRISIWESSSGNGGNLIAMAKRTHSSNFSCPMLMVKEIWDLIEEIALELAKKDISSEEIAFIGIANQRESALCWNKCTGMPLSRIISWKEDTGKEFLDCFAGMKDEIHAKTGLFLGTTFSALKWKHILEAEKITGEEIALGTVDSWILFNLTNRNAFLTDVTNASRTMLMNIHTGEWDVDLANAFGIPMQMLPEIKPSNFEFGRISHGAFKGIPIRRIIGDQQASLYAQTCGECGILKCTYGSGCFLMANTAVKEELPLFFNELLTTVTGKLGEKMFYALEAYIPFGAVELNEILQRYEFGSMEEFDEYASGALSEANAEKTRIAREFYCNLCGMIAEKVRIFHRVLGVTLEFRADGGLSKSNLLMKMQAQKLGIPVRRMRQCEGTSMGAIGIQSTEYEIFHPLAL